MSIRLSKCSVWCATKTAESLDLARSRGPPGDTDALSLWLPETRSDSFMHQLVLVNEAAEQVASADRANVDSVLGTEHVGGC